MAAGRCKTWFYLFSLFVSRLSVKTISCEKKSCQKKIVSVSSSNSSCGGVLVPSKGEPAGFISLASHVLIFMNKHLLTSESPLVKTYVRVGLSEAQMSSLAAIIVDLDADTYEVS